MLFHIIDIVIKNLCILCNKLIGFLYICEMSFWKLDSKDRNKCKNYYKNVD